MFLKHKVCIIKAVRFVMYCGINLLLGHQYGSHYLYLNFKNSLIIHEENTKEMNV